MLVLDASAAVDLLVQTRRGQLVAQHLRGQDVTAPDLLDVEVCSAVARLERAGDLVQRDADSAIRRLSTMPVRRLPCVQLLPTAWRLRDRVRVADAFYVACASITGGVLLTCDARLAAAPLPGLSITLVR